MYKFFSILWNLVKSLILLLMLLWGALQLYYHPVLPVPSPKLQGNLFGLLGLAALLAPLLRPLRWTRGLFVLCFVALLVQWLMITPSAVAQWPPELARVTSYSQRGNAITVNNVRNFDWRSETSFTPRWESRDYKLNELVTADLFVIYWDGPAIAHTIMSFGFKDGQQLAFSIESRHQGQPFSATEGLFKTDQILYIAADERDLLTLRHIRGDEPYLYRLRVTPQAAQDLFLAYLKNAADIAAQPRFYNTITNNCTTEIYDMIKRINPDARWNWRILFNGFLPAQLYDTGLINTNYSLQELQNLGRLEPLTLPLPASQEFSGRIRQKPPAPFAAHP